MTLANVRQAQRRLRAASVRQDEARDLLREAVREAREGEPCIECQGYGYDTDDDDHPVKCFGCNGAGYLERHTLAEIGEALGMTKQSVYALLREETMSDAQPYKPYRWGGPFKTKAPADRRAKALTAEETKQDRFYAAYQLERGQDKGLWIVAQYEFVSSRARS